ncbi:histidine kinase [Epilithonimonas ginsengisoli]|uniref:Histidine kinase n=1 Tax=Epilithonimonas ginsengisoli TaxID=1245592 RepID=A0ABU4JD22_9FLAO|nr:MULTISPECIES: histidine kinase [Chryseobacterium group]MBV6878542.1 histidine kinase [Epilithonimonas sp. FP105]MDW8547567.1 histidine kinase [Epilithonimonas ginsengisoli]OAH75166.1 histidine kinase [Chryseobacterium sp. FP211-J200]
MRYNHKDIKEMIVIDFLIDRKFRVLRHFLFLLFFFLLMYNARFWHDFKPEYEYMILFFVYVSLLIMIYINIYILVPLFFFKTHYLLYLALLIIMGVAGLNLIGFCFTTVFSDYRIADPIDDKRGMYEGVLMCLPIILMSTTVRLLQKWTNDNKRIVELDNLTLNMELKELRNQINPHFLFNMLNNVKALIRTDPEKASTVIVKLSEFLRYQLYENNEEKTLLTSEIEFLSNFINLEKIRRENFCVEIKTETDKKILNTTFIPPNLFTTFVENAIKHSVEINDNPSFVHINIEIKDKNLLFVCTNSRNPNYSISNENYGGLGLANIKRRLELLYQDKFDLNINSTDQEYIVNLSIPL